MFAKRTINVQHHAHTNTEQGITMIKPVSKKLLLNP